MGAGCRDDAVSVTVMPRAAGGLAAKQSGARALAGWAALAGAVAVMLLAVLNNYAGGAGGGAKEETAVAWARLLQNSSPNCAADAPAGCTCEEAKGERPAWRVALEWLAIVVLVCMSALFSGLTLGLMSLDLIGLEIVIGGDPDSADAKYAKKIKPVRARGNLLLCTLLLGNVAVNALLSILMADYTSGAVGFVLSTFIIVIFGEIFPQATCSRNALYVGAKTLPIVKFFMVLLFPVAFPISWVLDRIFKAEIGAIYSSGELKKLVEIHKQHNMVDLDQAKMMDGALTFKEKTVQDVMTMKKGMFMLQMHDVLSFDTLTKIFQAGCSRIPVYDSNDRNNIVGLLLTKDLILIDPEDKTKVGAVVQFFGRQVQFMWPDTKLPEALRLFRTSRTHMALVRDVNNRDESKDPFYEVMGLVTLEDIIEEILQEEILDETDAEADPADTGFAATTGGAVKKVDRATFDFALLRLLDNHRTANKLTNDEAAAIVAHLSTNLTFVKGALQQGSIKDDQIKAFVQGTTVLDLGYGEQLYKAGKPLTHCTLILSGSLDIISGAEGFRSTIGQWSLVGQSALDLSHAKGRLCDFTATVTSEEGVRCIRLSRHSFEAMLRGETPNPDVSDKGLSLTNGQTPPHTPVEDKPLAEETLENEPRLKDNSFLDLNK